MMWKFCTSLILSILLIGCASEPDEIAAAYVSPLQYRDYNCRQISNEMVRLTRKVGASRALVKDRASDDALNMGLGLILFWPSLFFIKGDGPHAFWGLPGHSRADCETS